MRFRGKSIRRKIVVLLLVPLVSLVSIWAFATYITTRQAHHLLTVSSAMDRVNGPVTRTTRALQHERRLILVHLADPRSSDALNRLGQQQHSTDRAVAQLRETVDDDLRDGLGPDARRRLTDLFDALDGLEKVRGRVERNTITRGGAFQAYNELIEPAHRFLTSLHALHQVDLERQGNALVGLARAREYLARENALMAAALAAGEMTRADQRAFSDRIAERHLAFDTNLQRLPAQERQLFQNYWKGTSGRTLRSYENAVLTAPARDATDIVSAQRWQEATSTVLDDLRRLRSEVFQNYQERLEPARSQILLLAGAAGLLGLIAVVASLMISIRVGRGLIHDLSALRKQANESADVRLPSVMRRLAAADQVDVETEAPRLNYPADEMGQVGKALNTLQRAAVEAAVKQADMRRGVSEVFVNLARRSQVLLHRQLTLLDTMERRTEDADELADLFRLDHLTTRMRRHAEGLVILSGAAPSRQWRKPVQLMDVVRAAVGEVEDYERIEIRRLPPLAVDGGAVADITHLVAELLENATIFSPPHTAVQVRGERVANGFTLEIHDRGLGMSADALWDANIRLAETPEFELSDTDRLGLFVVSRLALRQGVRVSLQPSPYGGTTAVVLIPGAVLTELSNPGESSLSAAVSGGSPGDGDGRPRMAGLPQGRASALEEASADGPAAPLDGPVELEAPLADDLQAPDGEGGLFRRGAGGESHDDAPAETRGHRDGDEHEHEQAGDQPNSSTPLPRRRRGAPVLVADHGRTVDTDNRTESGLPRRVRQASIAPQLRTETGEREISEAPDLSGEPAVSEVRDAEEVRSRMTSLQRGWQRGRHQAEPSADTTRDTASGTTPEGEGR